MTLQNKMQAYYYIYRPNAGISSTYSTLESALKESKRLSAEHPGSSFEILKCVAVTRAVTPETLLIDEMEDLAYGEAVMASSLSR